MSVTHLLCRGRESAAGLGVGSSSSAVHLFSGSGSSVSLGSEGIWRGGSNHTVRYMIWETQLALSSFQDGYHLTHLLSLCSSSGRRGRGVHQRCCRCCGWSAGFQTWCQCILSHSGLKMTVWVVKCVKWTTVIFKPWLHTLSMTPVKQMASLRKPPATPSYANTCQTSNSHHSKQVSTHTHHIFQVLHFKGICVILGIKPMTLTQTICVNNP